MKKYLEHFMNNFMKIFRKTEVDQKSVQADTGYSQSPKTFMQKYFLRLTTQEKIIFAKRLSQLIKAGVPILAALSMLKKQSSSKNSALIVGHLHAQVENGAYLYSGMAGYRKIFGDFAVNIIRVGEVSGTLQENLNHLAEELKKQQELKRKVISALVYPVFIALATIGVVILLTAYVFPKIMPIFQSFKFQLPWTTRTLIFISNIFLHFGFYIFLSTVGLIIIAILLQKKYKVKLWVHKNMFRLPLLGPMLKSYNIANFTRTLSLLLKSDVRIVEAMEIIVSISRNFAYRQEYQIMVKKLTQGEKLSTYMETQKQLFPIIMTQMVSVGEATGGLSLSLKFLSEMYEDDLDNATRNLTTSIEPILMIFMGLLVGFIALSIITPIYGITQNFHP